MPISSSRKFFLAVLMSGFAVIGQAQEVNSRWQLLVLDLQHKVKVEATVRLLAEPATESCMAGTWKRAVVEAKSTYEEKFFPLDEPLAYQLLSGGLTLGRTDVCDGYTFLNGKSSGSTIRGTYDLVSIQGAQKLGYFILKKVP